MVRQTLSHTRHDQNCEGKKEWSFNESQSEGLLRATNILCAAFDVVKYIYNISVFIISKSEIERQVKVEMLPK